MPYKKAYTRNNVGTGASHTPKSVMGGQGKSASIKPSHHMSKSTMEHEFPGTKEKMTKYDRD